MKRKILKILSFMFTIMFLITGSVTFAKEIDSGREINLGNESSINSNVGYETDGDNNPDESYKQSDVIIEGYVGTIKDPTVDYISVTVPTTGFFQIVTNPPASYGGKAVWVTPTYKVTNDGPNPIRLTLDDVTPHYDAQPQDIEMSDTAGEQEQSGNSRQNPPVLLNMALCTLQNWLNSDRTPKKKEDNPKGGDGISLRTFGKSFLDGANLNIPGIYIPLTGYRVGYIDGISNEPIAEKREGHYKLEMRYDTLASNAYNTNIKNSIFTFTFSIHSVVLTTESEVA